MKTSENVSDFLERMQKEREERMKQYEVETVKLPVDSGMVYRFHVVDSWGKQDDQMADYMGFRFSEDSPVVPGFKNENNENVFYMSGISLRNFRNRVLRRLGNNDDYVPLMVFWDKEKNEAVNVRVPVIPEGGIDVQFVIVEEEGKRYKQVFGEVVDSFGDAWETADVFVARMHKEYEEWRETQDRVSEGERLKLEHNILYECKLTSAFAQRTDDGSPGEFVVFNFDPETLDYTGYDGGIAFNRMLLSGNTLRTFIRDVLRMDRLNGLTSKEEDTQVQVSFNRQTKEPEFVGVPFIPADGAWARFVRMQPEGKNYYLVKGEMFQPQ